MVSTTDPSSIAVLSVQPERNVLCLTFDWNRSEELTANLVAIFYIAASTAEFAVLPSNTLRIATGWQGVTFQQFDEVPHFWPAVDSGWHTIRIEMIGSTNSDDGGNVPNSDGTIRIWIGNTVADLELRYERTDVPIGDWREVVPSQQPILPYTSIIVNAQGAIDNFAWSDSLCSEQPGPGGGTCCGNGGPGGAPPGQQPGDPPVTTPRTIPPGGYPPSYTACTGGGQPATASDPADQQTGDGMVVPRVHLQWTLADATVRRFGAYDFVSSNGGAVSGRVLSWGAVATTLADREGSFRTFSTTVVLADADRAIRNILDLAPRVGGTEVVFWIEDAHAGALPRALARGVLSDWRTGSDRLTVELDVTDPLGYRYSSVSLDRPVPDGVISAIWAPQCPEQNRNRPIPIIYGEVSDDYTWSLDPARIPAGIVPCIHVGPAHTINGLSAYWPEVDIQAFLVCGHAVTGIPSWFGSNVNPDGAGSVRMDPGTAGVDFYVPGESGWRAPTDYIDVVGSDGVTRRMTFILARGPRSDDAVSGRVPITCNVCGIESVGDGSGTLITDLAWIVQHFLAYFVLQDYTTGSWGAVPAFSDGTPKVRTSSFDAAQALHEERVHESSSQAIPGYQGDVFIGQQRPSREWLTDLMRGADLRLGVNHHGQIVAVSIDDVPVLADLETVTAEAHILDEQQFRVVPALSEIINVQDFECGVEPATGRLAHPRRTIHDDLSIAYHGRRHGNAWTVLTTRVLPTAEDVVGRRVARSGDPRPYVEFPLDLQGLDLTLGQLIRVTHHEGIGEFGWTDRVLIVVGVTTDPNALATTVHAEDFHGYLVLPGSSAEPAVVATVGLEADSTAAVVGLEADLTARRAG
jgi:hypothetical protein